MNTSSVATVNCDKCKGKGVLPDQQALGHKMRRKRQRRGMSLTETAVRMGFSKAYVSDLERGRRAWSIDLMISFEAVTKGGAR